MRSFKGKQGQPAHAATCGLIPVRKRVHDSPVLKSHHRPRSKLPSTLVARPLGPVHPRVVSARQTTPQGSLRRFLLRERFAGFPRSATIIAVHRVGVLLGPLRLATVGAVIPCRSQQTPLMWAEPCVMPCSFMCMEGIFPNSSAITVNCACQVFPSSAAINRQRCGRLPGPRQKRISPELASTVVPPPEYPFLPYRVSPHCLRPRSGEQPPSFPQTAITVPLVVTTTLG